MKTSVSIAMATYNGAKYLQEQLDSFLYQTRKPNELVVCDDGSDDETIEILTHLSKIAPFPVHIHRNVTNLGYVKNFEKALGLCTGDVIFLSDQDDVWFCKKIETMTKIITERRDVFVLQADMILTDENMNPSPFTQFGNIIALGHSSSAIHVGCGSAIRREWLDLALPISLEKTGHDNWIHRLATALEVREFFEEPLQYYRRHLANASNWHASKLTKLSSFDSLREHGLKSATVGWRDEFDRVKATRTRLAESYQKLESLGLQDRLPRALSKLDDHMNALATRIDTMNLSRSKRFISVVASWMRGDYQHFSGWKSAIKDMLRP